MAPHKKLKVDQATKGVKRKLEDSQLDDDAFTTPTKCARRTRTVDDLASRTAKDNFADFTDHQLHVLRAEANDNRTLIEELVMQNNLRMSKSPLAQKMGKNDYSLQRSLYQLDDSPIKQMKTLDADNPDIQGLSQALAPACKCPRSFEQITQWLRRDWRINQRALVLIVQTSLRNPPVIGLKQLSYAMECLKFIARNDLHKTYPIEWKIIKPHFDNALRLSYEQATKRWSTRKIMVDIH